MRIILASQSPRRSELLTSIGLPFEVHASGHSVNEAVILSGPGSIEERLCRLAELKCQDCAHQNPDALVLGADTEVLLEDVALGKPQNRDRALAMLKQLSGREHRVVTAICLRQQRQGLLSARCASTSVYFRELSGEQMERYVDLAQPFDFAGGYAIQGLGALLVEKIDGEYSTVVGMPLGLLGEMLDEAGVKVL